MGVAKTDKAFRVEVSKVCRNYCLMVWNEPLNQVGVEASSTLRREESVYYPPAIHAPGSAKSKADTTSEVADLRKDSPTKVFLFSDSPSKEAEQPEVVEKEVDTTKPLAVPQNPLKEKRGTS